MSALLMRSCCQIPSVGKMLIAIETASVSVCGVCGLAGIAPGDLTTLSSFVFFCVFKLYMSIMWWNSSTEGKNCCFSTIT